MFAIWFIVCGVWVGVCFCHKSPGWNSLTLSIILLFSLASCLLFTGQSKSYSEIVTHQLEPTLEPRQWARTHSRTVPSQTTNSWVLSPGREDLCTTSHGARKCQPFVFLVSGAKDHGPSFVLMTCYILSRHKMSLWVLQKFYIKKKKKEKRQICSSICVGSLSACGFGFVCFL